MMGDSFKWAAEQEEEERSARERTRDQKLYDKFKNTPTRLFSELGEVSELLEELSDEFSMKKDEHQKLSETINRLKLILVGKA